MGGGILENEQVEAYNNNEVGSPVGGKKRRKGSRRTRTKGRKGQHKKSMKRKGTKKRKGNKKGPSKWIMHVKAFCKKTGKTFPEALKDPMCRKSFNH